MTPSAPSSSPTTTAVLPWRSRRVTVSRSAGSSAWAPSSCGRPTKYRRPSTSARTPLPGIARKRPTSGLWSCPSPLVRVTAVVVTVVRMRPIRVLAAARTGGGLQRILAVAGLVAGATAGDRRQAGFGGAVDDGPRQRVLAEPLDGRGHGEQPLLRHAVQADDVGDLRPAGGERAGLVEGDRPQLGRLLQVHAALDEHAVARGAREGGEDADRRGDDQGARAADDEQRQAAVEPRVERGAEQRRHEGDGRRHRHDDRRVARREAVDDALGRGALRLRLLHEVDDLGDGVVGGGRTWRAGAACRPRRWSRRTPGRRAPSRPGRTRR